jgi:hypothetical protein
MQMAIYQPTLDGADMPRANEFVKVSSASFDLYDDSYLGPDILIWS